MDDATYAHSSASSSDNSDRGTHSHYSSRRVLAHVLARKERDSKKMHQLLKLTFAKLDEESQRATDAERRAAECLVRARSAIDARAQADADAASVRTELAMYKVQLDQAQREIFRAQELLTGLEARRHDAEEDAARARNVARKLQEERAVEAAREEGKQQGWQEGVRRGMLLGRQEAEEELLLRSRRREQEMRREQNLRPRSRGRRVDDPLYTRVVFDEPRPSEESSSDHVTPPSRARNGRHTPDVLPHTQPPTRHRGSASDLASSIRRRDTPQSHQRSRSRPPFDTPTPPAAVPEPARSRPYTPHEDSTPSLIQPIPVPASASSSSHLLRPTPSPSPPSPRHTPVQIPPDNWIPRAQDPAGDGRLSIFLPPPHEFVESLHHPEGPYSIAATPEEGSPAVVPPNPDFSPSPPTHVYAPTPPPPDLEPSTPQTPRRGRSRHNQEREYQYAPAPPPPDVREREYASSAAPPPPELHAPNRITKVTSNHSRASTHLSEFDLLAPVDQQQQQQQQQEDEDELEYVDVPTEPIPRQPIAMAAAPPNPPPPGPLQRRRATYDRRPSRGPPPPRRIVLPAPLSQAAPPPPQPQSYTYNHAHAPQQQAEETTNEDGNDTERDEDAPLLGLPPSERNRPHRSRTQSSGVIGISVEPPSPGNSPPSSGHNTALQRRADLLSPEHAERQLPIAMPAQIQIPYSKIFRNNNNNNDKPQPVLPPLPEFELAGLGTSPSADTTHRYRSNKYAHNTRQVYETAPLPDGIEYPASPLVGNGNGARRPRRANTASSNNLKAVQGNNNNEPQPLSPLVVASGLSGLKGRLMMPWRRNTAK